MNLTKLSQSNIWIRFWQLWQSKGIKKVIATTWSYFWLRFSGLGYWGRIATWLATWLAPPYKMRRSFARYYPSGYIAPGATIDHNHLEIGANVFVGDRVKIITDGTGGVVKLADSVYLHNDICIQTGADGRITIGSDTHIQNRCQFLAAGSAIQIGSGVQIAPNCVFCLSYHEIAMLDRASSKKDITVEDDVWIGHGATILGGTRIGQGAVIGSGAIVDRDIPDGAIAVGVPVRVIGKRNSESDRSLNIV